MWVEGNQLGSAKRDTVCPNCEEYDFNEYWKLLGVTQRMAELLKMYQRMIPTPEATTLLKQWKELQS